MDEKLTQISYQARRAIQQRDWSSVSRNAQHIIALAPKEPEGFYLQGMAEKANKNSVAAIEAFQQALDFDPARYDAAIELAFQLMESGQPAKALVLLNQYEPDLSNSPRYLDLAGTLFTGLDLPERAWPLYQRANELQPGIELFEANLAGCAVHMGEIEFAENLYIKLLSQKPEHQRNHYQLSRLKTARDDRHVKQMQRVLRQSKLPDEGNIFLCYALGKELEDLGRWEECFETYKRGADAVTKVSNYRVEDDISLIDTIIEVCNKEWFDSVPDVAPSDPEPVFVFGLPRTGSTLTERIISSHSAVTSVGETQFLENLLRTHTNILHEGRTSENIIRASATIDHAALAEDYLAAVSYQLSGTPRFLEKLPYNFLYAGIIKRTFPHAKMVYVDRHPMDACFAMYKQVFTWAYQFSYNLENLADYYIAHRRLLDHWKKYLGDSMIIVRYEDMVADQEAATRRLLEQLNLPFEEQCLTFEKNNNASTTASSVQIRQGIYTGSVGKWKHFADALKPLENRLTGAGIPV